MRRFELHESLELFGAAYELVVGDKLDTQHEAGNRVFLGHFEVADRFFPSTGIMERRGEHFVRTRMRSSLAGRLQDRQPRLIFAISLDGGGRQQQADDDGGRSARATVLWQPPYRPRSISAGDAPQSAGS